MHTQVVITREHSRPGIPPQPPCALGSSGGSGTQRVAFPYAILEVKLADGDSCPDWVLVCMLPACTRTQLRFKPA